LKPKCPCLGEPFSARPGLFAPRLPRSGDNGSSRHGARSLDASPSCRRFVALDLSSALRARYVGEHTAAGNMLPRPPRRVVVQRFLDALLSFILEFSGPQRRPTLDYRNGRRRAWPRSCSFPCRIAGTRRSGCGCSHFQPALDALGVAHPHPAPSMRWSPSLSISKPVSPGPIFLEWRLPRGSPTSSAMTWPPVRTAKCPQTWPCGDRRTPRCLPPRSLDIPRSVDHEGRQGLRIPTSLAIRARPPALATSSINGQQVGNLETFFSYRGAHVVIVDDSNISFRSALLYEMGDK